MRTKASAAIGNKVTLCLGLMITAMIASAFCAFQDFGMAPGLRFCVAALLLVPTVLCAACILSSASDVAAQVKSLEREAVDLESVAKAQENLEENLNALRDLCYRHGDPRVVSGNFCFGDYVINGTNDIVDEVQKRHGGAATIFHGAERISTNVKDQNNQRLIGTRLGQGPAFDKVFNQGKTYRGDATIAGVAYLTLYEPVMCGTQVAGIIFVAVAKAQALGAEIETKKRKPMETIRLSTERIREVVIARDSAMRIAAEQRCELTDRRRKQKALERVAALAQQNVVLALSSALERLASADLTSSIEGAFPQEYQKVKDDFGSATEALRKALTAITSETRSIRAGSMDISSAVDELSLRTEKQAASLEETAASLGELTVAVRQTAANVDKANKAVGETRTTAESSRDVMRDAVSAMAEIDKSSRQISQINSVINEIAFQTNLLALNAGVEAARAGEGGRGFAVVAAEVRALAQRSAEAALEIKSLIETSAQQVEKGVNLIGATGSALEVITDKVKGVSDIITNIAASTQEQALSLQEINAAITQMDRFTQQNAAMVEESTAASHVLSQQAASLETLVGQFQTGKTVVSMAA